MSRTKSAWRRMLSRLRSSSQRAAGSQGAPRIGQNRRVAHLPVGKFVQLPRLLTAATAHHRLEWPRQKVNPDFRRRSLPALDMANLIAFPAAQPDHPARPYPLQWARSFSPSKSDSRQIELERERPCSLHPPWKPSVTLFCVSDRDCGGCAKPTGDGPSFGAHRKFLETIGSISLM